MVVENVRGAQDWVGRADHHFGSFYLWGDVPIFMPAARPSAKSPGLNWNDRTRKGQAFNPAAQGHAFRDDLERRGVKVAAIDGGRRTDIGKGARFTSRDCGVEGRKNGNDWFGSGADCSLQRRFGSKSSKRKMASAMIAKIPLDLSRHVARFWHPSRNQVAA